MMIGIEGPSLQPWEAQWIKEAQPAGVIYFRRNVQSPNQLIELTRSITALMDAPPLIAIDQEGGIVARLSKPFTIFPDNEALLPYFEATGDSQWFVRKAQAMARELKAVGINLNFTPVADILSNDQNPIMKHRTFGNDPQQVAQLMAQTIAVYNQEGVLSCAKHFPGHGETSVDSHLALPTVEASRQQLAQREWVPFERAAAIDVPTMMTAHIVFPKIDAERPATMSPYFLQTILRKKMKYKGLVFSDDMEMKAIAAHQPIAKASERALKAGCNIVLICETFSHVQTTHAHLCQRVEKSAVLSARVQETTGILNRLRKRYALGTRRLRKRKQWGWRRHQAWADQMKKTTV